MSINFKGGYFNFKFFTKSELQRSLDKVQLIHGQNPLTGLCPWTSWTLSSLPGLPRLFPVSLDKVQTVHWFLGLTGLCPWTHWTFSRVFLNKVQTVHWVHGKSPGNRSPGIPLTFYRRVNRHRNFGVLKPIWAASGPTKKAGCVFIREKATIWITSSGFPTR